MQTTPETVEPVAVDTIELLAHVVRHWHEKTKATLEHTMRIPVGTAVEFDNQEPVVLEGDLHKGFRLGVEAALIAIDELPFFSSEEPSEPSVDVQSVLASNETH